MNRPTFGRNKAIYCAITLLFAITLAGCEPTSSLPQTPSPEVTTAPTLSRAPVVPTLSSMPTPVPATPIPLKNAPHYSWDQESIDLPIPLYAVYNLKDEPVVNMDNFPALIWDGKDYEIIQEDDIGGGYVLHGSPFSNYREELSVVRRNTDSGIIGASCWWNFNGKERELHMFEGAEQDARDAVESYFSKVLGSDFISALGRIAVEKTLTEEQIYTVRLYRSIDGMELHRPVIDAYITEEGFRYYYLNLSDYERDTSHTIERPITFEEALYSLNYYFEKHSSHPDFLWSYELSDARLMLTGVFTEEYWHGERSSPLSPAWVFTLAKDKPDMNMTVEEVVYVDVRTGRIYNDSNPGGLEDSPFQDVNPD